MPPKHRLTARLLDGHALEEHADGVLPLLGLAGGQHLGEAAERLQQAVHDRLGARRRLLCPRPRRRHPGLQPLPLALELHQLGAHAREVLWTAGERVDQPADPRARRGKPRLADGGGLRLSGRLGLEQNRKPHAERGRVQHPLQPLLQALEHGVIEVGDRDAEPVANARTRREVAAAHVVRGDRHLVALGKEFEALGVDLVALDQAIDTTTPSRRLLFHVLASIAEFERDLIRDRVIAGIKRARAQGRRLGRPRQHHVDAVEARRLRGEGLSLRAVARALGVHPTAVSRALAAV